MIKKFGKENKAYSFGPIFNPKEIVNNGIFIIDGSILKRMLNDYAKDYYAKKLKRLNKK
jgi:hypothetical protein